LNVRHLFGIWERLILGAVMGAILFLVERMLTSPGDLQRVRRLLRRVSDQR
jgi:hypothetical protein